MSKNREIKKKRSEYKKQGEQQYAQIIEKLYSANEDAKSAAAENRPSPNNQWIKRQREADRLTALNSMISLMGQGLIASAGVHPGKAPQLSSSSSEIVGQINKVNDDYRYDQRAYSQERLREAMQRQQLLEQIASKQLASDDKQAERESREKIADDRNELAKWSLEQNNASRERIAESGNDARKELQEMRSDSAKEQSQVKSQQTTTKSKEPLMIINGEDKERKPIYENEFIELYDEAYKRGLLNDYKRAGNENVRNNELRRAMQKAYDLRSQGAAIPFLGGDSPINGVLK